MRVSVLDRARTNYLNVHAPEEQSTVRELTHCQKDTLSPLGDGGGSWGGLICFASPESGRTPALAPIVFA